jgi:Domain of unknown function (DUF4276)
VKFVEVFCEGGSDVPAVREILQRRFGLLEDEHFRIHPHRGKGKLPALDHLPLPTDQTLLGQLPIKLKNLGRQEHGGFGVVVAVIVDADDQPPNSLRTQLEQMLKALPSRPRCCVFGIAVEETESWFVADPDAVKAAFPKAKANELAKIEKDAISGAWESLARAIGRDPAHCGGLDKTSWATAIAPHLTLTPAASPSLQKVIRDLDAALRSIG